MRIVFSVYFEERDTEERTLTYTEVVETMLSIKEIDSKLELYDLFHSDLTVGHNLAFWDIYCFYPDTQDIIDRIKLIPRLQKSSNEIYKEPRILIIEEFNPGNTDDAFYPELSECYLYYVSRYECGCSSFFVFIMHDVFPNLNSIALNIISSAIYDWLKSKVNVICGKKNDFEKKKVRILNCKKLYRNFEKCTQIKYKYCQITGFNRDKYGNYTVYMRTINNNQYEILANAQGKILSFDELIKGRKRRNIN